MYRDILVHVDGSEAGRRRVQYAFDLAARTGARLSGLHVTPPAEVPPLYKPSQVAEVAAEITSRLASDARVAAAIFSEAAKKCSAEVAWSTTTGDLVEGISNRARYADLVVLGQYESQGSFQAHPLPIAHSVVLRCGRPVLVVPADVRPSSLTRIIIAWDGSREAVRAVHDALPILRLARSVQIVTIVDLSAEDPEVNAKDLSAHLAIHGTKVPTDILLIRTGEEHEALRKQIESEHYDLLVMGGYSHPLWAEFIFGGATQSILLSSKIPILVSH